MVLAGTAYRLGKQAGVVAWGVKVVGFIPTGDCKAVAGYVEVAQVDKVGALTVEVKAGAHVVGARADP